ncbi:MAG TPA: Rsd/AlgQ family anti-sigma factor [Alcanivorax sp.]|nr:Rsd/AlgQ family anti-sigma factor [Alcanivorax sp.]
MATPHPSALHPSAALDQWRRIEALLHAWLEQRRRLLVLVCSIQGLEGFQRPGSIQTQVREFCQLLMDYISAGHFEIYQELVREARLGATRGGGVNLASRILQQLDPSTEEALSFNEDFDTDDHCLSQLEVLPERLTRLTEMLEERFALEDQLILSVHSRDVTERARVLNF